MRKLLLVTALATATLGFAASAQADLVSITFVDFGGGIQPPMVPPGETAIALTAANLSGTYALVTGSSTDVYAAPAYSASTTDPNQYLAEEGGQTATLALGGSYTGVEIYVGSLDSYNTISFSNGLSYTGTELAAMSTAADSGSQTSGSSNGLFYFVFTPGEAVTSVTFASGSNALEVAGVSASTSTIPEAPTWAMMMLGFVGLGYAAFRRSGKARAVAI